MYVLGMTLPWTLKVRSYSSNWVQSTAGTYAWMLKLLTCCVECGKRENVRGGRLLLGICFAVPKSAPNLLPNLSTSTSKHDILQKYMYQSKHTVHVHYGIQN